MRKLVLFLLLATRPVFADQVFLKDAGSLTGRIVSQDATTVKVDVGGGIIGVPMDTVARIEKGRCALDDYEDRARALGPKDVDGWRKLGKWANAQGLSSQASEAYKKVLAVVPNDAEANQAFGRVELDGKWVTEEESYRARGYVQYGGEWMTPAEAQLAQQHEANVQARRDAEDRARQAEEQARDAERRAQEAEAEAK
ncbi:MAG TPA: hypothetical protein VJ826_08470, partial [Candidatus Polarisedimenticolaceae bacterium]|nr:hypothetical protein [Candidatus Polarisedimenticolaceae bacterium]